MEITADYKSKVIDALTDQRQRYGGSDEAFSRSMDINPAIYNRLKKGEREKVLSEAKWLMLGRVLGVTLRKSKWLPVETDVFLQIREEVLICKEIPASRIFVDNCGIGKTFTAKYLSKTEKNTFYIDCTQCRKRTAFIRAMARTIGVDVKGTLEDIKENTKYYLSLLEKPIIIIDEAGALDKDALGLLQEYWNATEDVCGWYLMGANALRNKISRGVSADRDYFAELFSRFSEKFSDIVPKEESAKYAFYEKLIRDVLTVNIKDKSKLNTLVKKCLVKNDDGYISGLRRAKTLLQLHDA